MNQRKLLTKRIKTTTEPEILFENIFKEFSNTFFITRDRYIIMGTSEKAISYSLENNIVTIYNNDTKKEIHEDIFTYLETVLDKENVQSLNVLPISFIGGYVGYFGYELKELTGGERKHQSNQPDSLWMYVDQFLVYDKKTNEVYICSSKEINDSWIEDMSNRIRIIEKESTNTKDTKRKTRKEVLSFSTSISKASYLNKIKTCKRYLEQGQSYEICLTNNLRTTVDIDPWELFIALESKNPTPYLTFLKHADVTIISATPESFIEIDEKRSIVTKPIKGTSKRSEIKDEDKELKEQLLHSEKDKAENLMITDLLRNDLGKICEIGSVTVPSLRAIETFETVHQMVSTVQGKLRKDISSIEAIKACFPGGSMTGAPKIRTMYILDLLETESRGIYSGAIGYISFNQTVSLNIVIRTIVQQRNELSIGAGGAIVIDSDPEKEYEEMMLKAERLLDTITAVANAKSYKIENEFNDKHTVYIALGSNEGDKEKYINEAIVFIKKRVSDVSVASLYKNPAKYYTEQDEFVNTVLVGKTDLTPDELLELLQAIEKALGRKKTFKNGPRTIDLDILFYDDYVIKNNELTIPHALLQERDFVLKPLAEIAPNYIHPRYGKSIKQLYDEL